MMLDSKNIASDTPLLEHDCGELPAVLAVRARSRDTGKQDRETEDDFEVAFAAGRRTPWVTKNAEDWVNAMRVVKENEDERADPRAKKNDRESYVVKETHFLPKKDNADL